MRVFSLCYWMLNHRVFVVIATRIDLILNDGLQLKDKTA
jgi:hypothetical protein